MQAEQNDLITRIGPGTPCGALLRGYLAAGGAGRRVRPAARRPHGRAPRSRRRTCSARTSSCSATGRAAWSTALLRVLDRRGGRQSLHAGRADDAETRIQRSASGSEHGVAASAI